MPVLDTRLLTRLHRLWLAAGHGRRTRGVGRWTDRRDYSPGDDYRSIDWRYCARHDELLVPRFVPAADDGVDFLLDCSSSMAVPDPGKFAAASKAVAAAAYGTLACSRPVGVTAYADRPVARLGPIGGRVRAGVVLAFLAGLSPDPAPADLAAAATLLGRARRRSGRVVVVSGTYDLAGLERGLEILLRQGRRPTLLRVYDPREAEPAFLGDVKIYDADRGRSWQATVTEADLRRYRQLYADYCRSLERYCASRAIGCVPLAADLAEDELLRKASSAVERAWR